METGDKLKTDDQEKNNGATIRRMTRNHESGENKVRNITEEKTKNKTERENQNEMRWELIAKWEIRRKDVGALALVQEILKKILALQK